MVWLKLTAGHAEKLECPPLNSMAEVDAVNKLAETLTSNDVDRAMFLCSRAICAANSLGYVLGKAEALRLFGKCAISAGKFELAEEALGFSWNILKNAEKSIFSTEKDRFTESVTEKIQHCLARTNSSLGELYLEQTKLDKALEVFTCALNLFELLHDTCHSASSHSNIGIVYDQLGLFDQAFEEYEKAEKLFDAQRADFGIKELRANNLINIGMTLKSMGQYAQALERFQKALAIFEETGSTDGEANALNNIAAVYCLQKSSLEKVLPLLNKAEGLTGDVFEQAFIHQLRGMYYAQQSGLLNLARKEYYLAIDKFHPNIAEEVAVLILLGELELREAEETGPIQLGLFILLEASLRAEQAGLTILQEKADRLLNKACTDLGQYRLANEAALRVIKIQEEIYSSQRKALDLHHKLINGYDDLEQKIIFDSLTGIYSRAHILDYLRREYDAALRTNSTFSVIMIDIDDFKRVNDTYGHVTGDKVLRAVATILKEGVRSGDMAARYGGEEMLVLLWGTPATAALDVAEKLRQQVQDYAWAEITPGTGVTISLGICDNKNATSNIELIEKADTAMYVAKQDGKNKAVLAPIDPATSR